MSRLMTTKPAYTEVDDGTPTFRAESDDEKIKYIFSIEQILPGALESIPLEELFREHQCDSFC